MLVVLALACCISHTWAQEDGAAPALKPRPSLRRPIGGKAAKTTTTAAPQVEEDNEYYDAEGNPAEGEDGEEDGAASASSTTTTTEAPKKTVGPVIRPFRSNDDFLNSLKRRQQDAKKHRCKFIQRENEIIAFYFIVYFLFSFVQLLRSQHQGASQRTLTMRMVMRLPNPHQRQHRRKQSSLAI